MEKWLFFIVSRLFVEIFPVDEGNLPRNVLTEFMIECFIGQDTNRIGPQGQVGGSNTPVLLCSGASQETYP